MKQSTDIEQSRTGGTQQFLDALARDRVHFHLRVNGRIVQPRWGSGPM